MPPIPASAVIKTAEGAAVLTKPAGLSPVFWAILVIGLPMLVMVLVALIKIAPAMTKAKSDSDVARDMGLRGDVNTMREDIKSLRSELAQAIDAARIAEERAHMVEMRMASLNAGFQLVAAELYRRDPENPVLKQARDIAAQATTFDSGFGEAMQKLARVAIRKEP